VGAPRSSQDALERQIAQRDSVIAGLRARLDGRELLMSTSAASCEDGKMMALSSPQMPGGIALGPGDEHAILNGISRSVGGGGGSETDSESEDHSPRQTRTRSGGIVSEDLPK
jgi:hypothetical protein